MRGGGECRMKENVFEATGFRLGNHLAVLGAWLRPLKQLYVPLNPRAVLPLHTTIVFLYPLQVSRDTRGDVAGGINKIQCNID